MTNHNVTTRIEALANEAAEADDLAMVEMCSRAIEYSLRDARTGETIEPETLFGHEAPMPEYVRAICESLDCEAIEGFVTVHGRTVYAG